MAAAAATTTAAAMSPEPPARTSPEPPAATTGGLISAPPIPVGFRSFRRNLVESSGVKFGRKPC